jgi:hypothetical protein
MQGNKAGLKKNVCVNQAGKRESKSLPESAVLEII